jgi:predicted ribonuclease YlaK
MSKKDRSPVVVQKDKIQEKDKFTISDRIIWTEKQKQIIDAALDKNTTCIILDGVAGTAKTLLSVYCSLRLMNDKKVSDLVYIRSLIQSLDGQTGYLTGDLDEKCFYYNIPLYDKLDELLSKPTIDFLEKQERIKTYPVSMLRGYNFNAISIIADEAQNLLFDSLITVATRVGKFSKLFICGDSTMQNDLGKKSGFKEFCRIFDDEESRKNGIVYFKLGVEDIQRSGLTRYIVEKVIKMKGYCPS